MYAEYSTVFFRAQKTRHNPPNSQCKGDTSTIAMNQLPTSDTSTIAMNQLPTNGVRDEVGSYLLWIIKQGLQNVCITDISSLIVDTQHNRRGHLC